MRCPRLLLMLGPVKCSVLRTAREGNPFDGTGLIPCSIRDIESQKLEIKAESKVGSLSNVKHKPGGGEKKIFDDKTYLKQISSGSSEGRASGIQTPEPISPSHSHHSSQLITEESQQQS
ncbi:unnamed protein product [Timema podura]|uniref:Microtubule-associated protein n=1 Tax=Timema podura TaxID=61482 RepID=A0ABN7PF76_TIMPD|nr:unnamed protein product [Timema podura]